MLRIASLLLVAFTGTFAIGQTIVNGYARVTSVAGTTLNLTNVDEGSDTFEDGEYVIIMQMQGNVIGTTTDVATFGSVGTMGTTGQYEVRQILSHTESAGVPTSITLRNSTTNTYVTGGNYRLQIITFPTFGSPDYTTTFDMTAKTWNSNTGGVLAFNVDGVLTLSNDLDADQDGFRGAGPNAGGSAGCSGGANYRVANQANMADKGESIYRLTNTGYAAGMGHILNGGGGGNSHNGGGGGGGNYTAGGDGGPGWPTCSPSAGGLGGLSLSAYITPSRVFMGGGGGAGEGNNNLATDGGDGGGIILIKANEIQTSCSGTINITADGESISFAGNDGGGGAGAGGSIIFQVTSWNISGTCPIFVSASGGDGGGVNSGATHGGGGGGGQGVVVYSITQPTTNTTTTTANGTGGCNNNSNPCTSPAGSVEDQQTMVLFKI